LLLALPRVAGALHSHAPRHAVRAPGASCQPFGRTPCLLPFPNDLYTNPDPTTGTGLRLRLPGAAMPVNRSGVRIDVGEYDRNDGFSPGSTLVVHVPGLDNWQAFEITAPAGLADISHSLGPGQPIVVVDEGTGERQLIWSELDATAPSAQTRNLLIHAGKNFTEGHTYAVALRNLRNAAGEQLRAPLWFERLRDGRPLPPSERPQRVRYERIFATLARAGVSRRGMYEAWDFTIASTASLTSRMLAIRNDAFAQLGDGDLGDRAVQGRPPAFTITSSDPLSSGLRRVQGTLQVPCYLLACGAGAAAGFRYGSALPDALPSQLPGSIEAAPFDCIVPTAASPRHPARIALYGHGFLSTRAEVEAAWVQQLAREYGIAFCATDWLGQAQADLPAFIQALRDVNRLPGIVDRIQQGVLNTLYLGRAMLNPAGFASDPAFQTEGRPVIDTSHLYFNGNSDGGILGGILTAASPDLQRAVLGVTGMNFFNLMVPRGLGFEAFGKFVLRNYRDRSLHPLILDLLQQLWDRGDADGYAQQMTSSPLPGTPAHLVLMQIAYGDFQVSMYAAAVEARTVGAFAYLPALEETSNRIRDTQLLFAIPPPPAGHSGGPAIVVWDSGPGRTQPPPIEGLPPPAGSGNLDSHEDPRYTPAAQLQISEFLQPSGAVADVCAAQPCRSLTYTR
jgi:hypothetical protein